MIIIVGAGITGLVLGNELKRLGLPFTLIEASSRVGGNIETTHEGSYLLEKGPNSLRMTDQLHTWLTQIGLEKEVLFSLPAAKNRFVLKNGKYRKLPKGPQDLLHNGTFSWRAKKALFQETKVPPESQKDETVDSFFRRRLGDEITDYVVYPFISGIYAGDPRQLMVEAAFPNLVKWEKQHGSLIKGMVRSRKTQRHKGICSFKQGLQHLIDHLAEPIAEHIVYNVPITRLFASEPLHVCTADGRGWDASQLVLTLPAYMASSLLQEAYPDQSLACGQIFYPPVAVVHSAYKRKSVKHRLNGFGALHNQLEESYSLGTLFSSSIFPGRCPQGEVLLTTFVGGSLHPQKGLAEEKELQIGVTEDHKRFLGVKAKPVFQSVTRWNKAIPQYHKGVEQVWAHTQELEKHGIFLAGNWRGGISVGACVESGLALAKKIHRRQLS